MSSSKRKLRKKIRRLRAKRAKFVIKVQTQRSKVVELLDLAANQTTLEQALRYVADATHQLTTEGSLK